MRRLRFVALFAALLLVAAACGDSGDTTQATSAGTQATTAPTSPPATDPVLAGTSVSVFGPESSEEEAGAMQDALDVFAAESGIAITYTGARDFSDQINAQAVGGNPPDIAIFPQPGKLADFGKDGLVKPVPADVTAAVAAEWPAAWMAFGNTDGVQYGLPNKSDLKSLVWYEPARFTAAGYSVPTTWAELRTLTDQIIADGETPWCIGIESGPATGWTFTDWNEDLMLRFEDENLYDQWVNHEIPFNDSRVEAIWTEILDLWNTPSAVYAAGGSIAATPFGDNGQPLVEDRCYMHRQASFFAAFMPDGTVFGPDGVDVFYFPNVDTATQPVLVAGTLAAAFRDSPEVWAVMEYLGSSQYGDARVAAQVERKGGGDVLSGYLSANNNVDISLWPDLEQSFINILQTGGPARFDASDLMPAAVGAGSFWVEATSVVNGDKSPADALAIIEDSWPTE